MVGTKINLFINSNFLLTTFQGHTIRNGPGLFHSNLWPRCEAGGPWIDNFHITFGLFSKALPGAHPFIWKLVFICMWMKTNFHMKWAPGLALKKRPKVIRKWPIEVEKNKVQYFFNPKNEVSKMFIIISVGKWIGLESALQSHADYTDC